MDVLAHQDDDSLLTDGVVALSAARRVEPMTFLIGQSASADGAEVSEHLVSRLPLGGPGGRLVHGRYRSCHPRRVRHDEAVAEANGPAVGDAMRLITLSPEQVTTLRRGRT